MKCRVNNRGPLVILERLALAIVALFVIPLITTYGMVLATIDPNLPL